MAHSVVRQALENAGVAASQIGYSRRTAGTRSAVPLSSSTRPVLREGRAEGGCLVGSVKTNIGHLEAAAGIAGLIKAALCLEREHVPPHLHVRQLNPHLATADSPLEIATRAHQWKRGGGRRFAGVSSFGFGGTNAHVVLEEAPASALAAAEAERPAHVLSLSARSDGALRELARRYADHLALHTGQSLPDVCFTANTGRAQFAHRLALAGESREQLARALRAFADEERADGLRQDARPGRRRSKGIPLTGRARSTRMGREIYETQPSFPARWIAAD